MKISHWSFLREGCVCLPLLQPRDMRESEDLRSMASSALCVLWGVRLSQKNGCGVLYLGAAVFYFQEDLK